MDQSLQSYECAVCATVCYGSIWSTIADSGYDGICSEKCLERFYKKNRYGSKMPFPPVEYDELNSGPEKNPKS